MTVSIPGSDSPRSPLSVTHIGNRTVHVANLDVATVSFKLNRPPTDFEKAADNEGLLNGYLPFEQAIAEDVAIASIRDHLFSLEQGLHKVSEKGRDLAREHRRATETLDAMIEDIHFEQR